MKFLRNLLAAIIGTLIAFGIIFIMFFIFISLISSSEDSVAIKKNSVLELQLQQPISDYVGDNTLDPFSGGLFQQAQGLDEILQAITVAKDDDDIKGISLNNNFILAGLAQTQAIRNALDNFKGSGKFVYAYADFYTQKDYYLASVADSVFMNPVGGLDFKGLSSDCLLYTSPSPRDGLLSRMP